LKMDSIMLTPNGLGNARDVEDSLSASAIWDTESSSITGSHNTFYKALSRNL
jgi:hypothetical protein